MQAKFRPATLAASVALAAVLASGAALAQVDVSNAWVRGTVPTQTASGAFMVLHAHDDAKLVGVSSPVAVAELHEMKMDLPRMQDVELKPGGYHVMLMGLKSQLKKGDTVPITLKIEQGGKVIEQKVTAEVRDMVPAIAGASGGHGEHKH
jgi:periplasmic copper chaperone A